MALPRNIRYLRKKQGWGQDTLAEKLGYKSYTTIQKWESGVSEPPLKVVHALAELFSVDINDLTNGDMEYNQFPQCNSTETIDANIIKIAGRDGYYKERTLTDEQLSALTAILDQMPDASDDL